MMEAVPGIMVALFRPIEKRGIFLIEMPLLSLDQSALVPEPPTASGSPLPMAAFSNHVSYVVGLSSDEEMNWIDTRRVIAMMQNLQAFWNLANKEPIGDVTCLKHFSFSGPGPDSAVAVITSASGPEDTAIRLFSPNEAKETIDKRNCFSSGTASQRTELRGIVFKRRRISEKRFPTFGTYPGNLGTVSILVASWGAKLPAANFHSARISEERVTARSADSVNFRRFSPRHDRPPSRSVVFRAGEQLATVRPPAQL